jgi:hypothetical protein
MNDRELLEAAAKAAGYRMRWVDAPTSFNYEGFLIKTGKKLPNGLDAEIRWNPLTNSGDALELAVKLNLITGQDTAWHYHYGAELTLGLDPLAATRCAIVRAAAEIGNGMAPKAPTDDLPEDNYYKTQAEAEELGRSMK